MKISEHITYKNARPGLLSRDPLAVLKKNLPDILPQFEQSLSDDFTLLVNFPLPGAEIHLPLVLTGPPGVQVITLLDLRGSYRARGGDWLVFNIDKRTFVPTRPNLVARAEAYAQAVRKHLSHNGLESQVVEPVLLFSDPGISVDVARPNARVVVRAGIDAYLYYLSETSPLLHTEQLFQINTALTHGRSATVPRPASVPPLPAPRLRRDTQPRRPARKFPRAAVWVILFLLTGLLLALVALALR